MVISVDDKGLLHFFNQKVVVATYYHVFVVSCFFIHDRVLRVVCCFHTDLLPLDFKNAIPQPVVLSLAARELFLGDCQALLSIIVACLPLACLLLQE